MAMADIDKMMNRIAGLLAKAESTEFPEEAKSLRAKAEELMRTYRIAEEQLIRESVSSGAPIWRDVPIASYESAWETSMSMMFWNIADHCGIKGVAEYVKIDGAWSYVARVVGYEIDIRLAEMIFNSARLAFFAKLEPEFDPKASEVDNVYRLRGSGMDRQTVALKVFGQKGHAEGIKVGKIYREECERRGEIDAVSGRGFNANLYRTAYADSFRQTIRTRLRNAADAADASTGALVLPEREARVNEALYTRYPKLRPETPEERAERKAKEAAAAAACPAKEEKAVDRRRKAWTVADEAAWRRRNSPRAQAAREAGASAARSVDLTRQAPGTNRAEAAPEREALGG
jgi:hypothetical protein